MINPAATPMSRINFLTLDLGDLDFTLVIFRRSQVGNILDLSGRKCIWARTVLCLQTFDQLNKVQNFQSHYTQN